MTELGELLELLHRSRRGFQTFHGRYRLWRHEELHHEAFRAAAEAIEADGGTGYAVLIAEGEKPRPSTVEGEWRIWLERPYRIREEFDGEDFGAPLGVKVGRRWWSYDRWNGAITNEGQEEVGSGVGEAFSGWLEPASVLGLLEFEPLGEGEVASRRTLNARAIRATPGIAVDHDAWELDRLGVDAEEYELALDAERGVILRLEARHRGQPFFIGEARTVEFDQPLAEEIFVFRAPEGEEVRALEHQGPAFDLPIEEVVERAPFAVFVPARVPRDWELSAGFMQARERPPMPALAVLHYRSADGTASVQISEHAASAGDPDDDVFDAEDAPTVEHIERDGATMEVRGRTSEWPQSVLRTVREGTEISMYSDQLSGDALVDLAMNLEPARGQPPQF
jgi:outer membrane lipoprotein-sorting protein